MKNIIRTDILTGKKYQKKELIRIAILKNKETILDNNSSGRGLYFNPKNLNDNKRWNILKFKVEKMGGDFLQISDKLSSFYYQGGNFNDKQQK
ncbi:DUF448 domain-containing protein [Candidatus Hepatoplasma crinochetorum]|uniref:YlxR domain-containing protein n=1 Tax=Candidatus Hepatoplasma crinochetorum Av TaxID=1427984 RepID=W8GES1_9MOLU|nr:DUF448 domain-containing protein [Candidatus Hepatoplasma crinochetorum]AHK22289.1 hypothetical protein X271_00181 [Candidatus Hepatoplasma crinochetorum Av]BDV02875.1 MAG: hypothetical protein HCTKY_1690 [Candidatus Hepatoplasma crinochetorum]